MILYSSIYFLKIKTMTEWLHALWNNNEVKTEENIRIEENNWEFILHWWKFEWLKIYSENWPVKCVLNDSKEERILSINQILNIKVEYLASKPYIAIQSIEWQRFFNYSELTWNTEKQVRFETLRSQFSSQVSNIY